MRKLIISCGLSGVGKSCFFEKVLPELKNTVYLVKDSLNDGMFIDDDGFVNDFKKPESEFYNKHIKMQTYNALFMIARDNLKIGNNVIIDGYFINKINTSIMNKLLSHLEKVDHDLKYVYIYCSKEELKRRIENRNRKGAWGDWVKERHLKELDERYQKAIEVANSFPFHLKLNIEDNIDNSVFKFNELINQ